MSKFGLLFSTLIQKKAQTGFEPVIFGLRDRRLTTWPLRQLTHTSKYSNSNIEMEQVAICAHIPFFFNWFMNFEMVNIKKKKDLAAVGFEPTPPKRLVP